MCIRDRATLEHVFRLKSELVYLRHVIAPSREIFSQLTSREFELIGEAQVFYFRDVYDHLIRLTDEFDSFRELVDVYKRQGRGSGPSSRTGPAG